MSSTDSKIIWTSGPGNDVPTDAGTLTRRFAHGERMTLAHFTFTAGTVLPVHEHDNEQFSTILQGRLRFTIGQVSVEAGAGETIHLLPHVPHGAVALEDTTVLDVFAPLRADW